MKKLISLLIIVIALVSFSSQKSNAQITIRVQWFGQCPDTCTSHEICSYKVEYQLYYICNGHQDLLCSGNTWVSCSATYADFSCNYSCDDPSNEKCYALTGRATKYCNGPLGNIAKCTGTGIAYYTCHEVMTISPLPVTVSW